MSVNLFGDFVEIVGAVKYLLEVDMNHRLLVSWMFKVYLTGTSGLNQFMKRVLIHKINHKTAIISSFKLTLKLLACLLEIDLLSHEIKVHEKKTYFCRGPHSTKLL